MGAQQVAVRRFREDDRSAVIALWERCELTRPWNDPDIDIDRKVVHDGTILVAVDESGSVVGTAMVGYDGHRGWINYLAADPTARRVGIGRTLMAAAEQHLAALGCPKINLQIRDDNLEAVAFYESLGYRNDAVVSMGKRLVVDAGDEPA